MKLHFQQHADEQNRKSAKVTIEILGQERPTYLTGTRALEVRPGFVTLEIPPLEQWFESLKWLPRNQRERLRKRPSTNRCSAR